mmetsp:Transcript_16068/g.49700  ORF Transcript_16068/g.49700 Transcript_16068/m.49700 type:complete len:1179 (+) Transcript_16068:286-3822(+)
MVDATARSIVPRSVFGFTDVVAIDHDTLTYLYVFGTRFALVSTTNRGSPIQFFSPVTAGAASREITAVSFHKRCKLLALCVCGLSQGSFPSIVIYSFTKARGTKPRGTWIPSHLETFGWNLKDSADLIFKTADFSADASMIVAVTKSPSVIAIGFSRKSRSPVFTTHLYAGVEKMYINPWDSSELSTSGPQHMQLWRLIKKKLKPCEAVKYTSCANLYLTQHTWLASEMLVAGTHCGNILVIHQNKQTQRFRRVHLAPVRGIVHLDGGFATVCSARGVCLFRQEHSSFKKGRNNAKLMRRIYLDGPDDIHSIDNFPGRGSTSTLLTGRDAVSILNFNLALTTSGKAKRLSPKEIGQRHGGDIRTISGALSRPVLVSCSLSSNCICIWNWQSKGLAVRHSGEEAPSCLDMHPSGFQLLVGFESEVHIHHIGHRALITIERIPTKGIVPLRQDHAPLVSTGSLSMLKYAHGGHLFAAVTGRLIQVFSTHSHQSQGKSRIVHALQGHACNVKGLTWSVEDQRLFTFSEDGAIYEWSIGSFDNRDQVLSRTRDYIIPAIKWSSIAMFSDGSFFAAGLMCASQNAKLKPLIRLWFGNLDSASVDICTGKRHLTTVLPVNPTGKCQGMLVVGTARGSLLKTAWPLLNQATKGVSLEEIPLCGGPIIALTFCCRDDTLCAASSDGIIVICDAGTDGHISQHTLLERGAAVVETVLIERSIFCSLEVNLQELVNELVDTKMQFKETCEEARPKFEMRLREQQEESRRHVRDLQLDAKDLSAQLASKGDAYTTALLKLRSKFEFEVKDLESVYERKLALEAMRYLRLQGKTDRLRLEAKKGLEQQMFKSNESERRWKRLSNEATAQHGSEVELLQEERARSTHWALQLLEQQEKHSDIDVFQLQEDTLLEVSDLKHQLNTTLHEKAHLKRRNKQLNIDYHRSRDELTECQQAYHAAHARARSSKTMYSQVVADLGNESRSRIELEELVKTHEMQISDLQRWKKTLLEQTASLRSSVIDCEALSFRHEKKCRHLDKSLEIAGQQNGTMNATLQSKINELRRVKRCVDEHTKQAFSRDKKIRSLAEEIDLFIFRLRNSIIRPQPAILSEFNRIRDAIVCLQSAGHHMSQARPRREAPHVRRTPPSQDLNMARQLRGQNTELMEELNNLRFDRLALRRKLQTSRTPSNML